MDKILKSPLNHSSTIVWLSQVKKSLLLILQVCLLAIYPFHLHGERPRSLKDFHGLKLNFFHEETGRRFLKLSYEDAVSESQKVGFLTMNLAFLKIRNLKIEMDANSIDCARITSLFEKVSKQRGIRYAVAEPINLIIRSPKSIIRIEDKRKAQCGWFFGLGDRPSLYRHLSKNSSVSIITDPSANSFLMTTGSAGNPSVPLSNQPRFSPFRHNPSEVLVPHEKFIPFSAIIAFLFPYRLALPKTPRTLSSKTPPSKRPFAKDFNGRDWEMTNRSPKTTLMASPFLVGRRRRGSSQEPE